MSCAGLWRRDQYGDALGPKGNERLAVESVVRQQAARRLPGLQQVGGHSAHSFAAAGTMLQARMILLAAVLGQAVATEARH